MPFAKKFTATMGLPDAGDRIDGFVVESRKIEHAPSGYGRYEYPIEIVVSGAGGQQGVRNSFRNLFAQIKTTFSGYGNAYQLRFGKMEVESLGERRYLVHGNGLGARVYLKKEIARFVDYLSDNGYLAPIWRNKRADLAADYIAEYLVDARRKYPDRAT